jgi:hypothetical protein
MRDIYARVRGRMRWSIYARVRGRMRWSVYARVRGRMRWSVVRRRRRLTGDPRRAGAAGEPRFWSLLLPPRYPNDRL